jgi:hypothetical protein
MKDYDESKEDSYIVYLDANNLYGYAMCEHLPMKDFKWNQDKWTKEEDDKKLRIAIQEVSRKSMGTLINWKKSNPDYADVNSEFSQQCISMQRNSVAGDDRDTFFPKVIRALNKEMVVDKNLQN